MRLETKQLATISTSSIAIRLRNYLLCVGLLVGLLQPSNLVAEAWNVLNSGNASGNWNVAGNWTPASVPNSASAAVDFSALDITADSTVTLDMNATVNSLTFGDAVSSSAAGWTLTGTKTNTLAGTTPTITVNAMEQGKVAAISVVLAGSAGMIKAGPGTLTLSKAATYTGTTTINNGMLKMMGANLITGNLTVNSPGIFDINANNYNTGTLYALNGDGMITNSITSSRNLNIGNNGAWSTFSGTIGGLITITKNSSGVIALTGPSTFDGSFRCQGGKITFNSVGNVGAAEPSALGRPTTAANGLLYMGSGGVSGGIFSYNGTNPTGHTTDRQVSLQTTGGDCTLEASGTGPLIFKTSFLSSGAGARTLFLGGTNTSTNEIAGCIPDSSSNNVTRLAVAYPAGISTITLSSVFGIESGASISGTGIAAGTTVTGINTSTKTVTLSQPTTLTNTVNSSISVAGVINQTFLTKNGAGTWVLSGQNTYTGPTTVNDGKLIVNGSLAANSTLTVAASKTFGGSGTIYGPATLAGNAILKPGNDDIGTLTFANTGNASLTLNTNLIYIALPNVTGPVDKVAVSGGLVLNGTNKVALVYSGRPRSGTHTIMTYVSKTGDGTFVFDQEYHPTPTLTIGDTSVTVTIPGEGSVLRFQ